jgi:hypothetical protein
MILKALYFKINLNVKKYKNVNLSEAAKIRGCESSAPLKILKPYFTKKVSMAQC